MGQLVSVHILSENPKLGMECGEWDIIIKLN